MSPGDRVTLMDPGPMATGVVIEDRGRSVWVQWDHGKRAWALASLLVPTSSREYPVTNDRRAG